MNIKERDDILNASKKEMDDKDIAGMSMHCLAHIAYQQTRIADALERYWKEEDAEREKQEQIDKDLGDAINNL